MVDWPVGSAEDAIVSATPPAIALLFGWAAGRLDGINKGAIMAARVQWFAVEQYTAPVAGLAAR